MKKKELERMLKRQAKQMDMLLIALGRNAICNQALNAGKVPEQREENDYLSHMAEESNRNAILEETNRAEDCNMLRKEFERYRKELKKERKARKKMERNQKEIAHCQKELQTQQRSMAKDFQKSLKNTERRYEKLKDRIKCTEQNEKKDVESLGNILRIVAFWGGISDSSASLKELEADFKRIDKRYRKKNAGIPFYNNVAIDTSKHEK